MTSKAEATEQGSSDAGSARVTVRCQFCETWNRVSAARVSERPKCGKCGKPILLDRPVKLDDDTFARTIEGTDVPVLVDFYADWCGPCRSMAPHVDELARVNLGAALVAKIDTDRATATAARFQIRGIPTVIVFREGHESARQSGAVPLATLQALLDG